MASRVGCLGITATLTLKPGLRSHLNATTYSFTRPFHEMFIKCLALQQAFVADHQHAINSFIQAADEPTCAMPRVKIIFFFCSLRLRTTAGYKRHVVAVDSRSKCGIHIALTCACI